MRVVKIGGRVQKSDTLPAAIKATWDDTPGELCVVHGGGDEVSALQRAMGRESVFVGGRRVTSKSDLDLLRMVLSGVINKRLVNSFVRAGIAAVGLSGEDAGLIEASIIDAEGLGFAGRPSEVNITLITTLLAGGFMPVVSPVAFGGRGNVADVLNVNGDDAAAAIAIALGASELLFVADVAGVRDSHGKDIATLTLESAQDLIDQGIANAGMAAKLDSARVALTGGVESVRICDLGGLLDSTRGTVLVQSAGITS